MMRGVLTFTIVLLFSFAGFGQVQKLSDAEYAVFMSVLGADRADFVVEDKSGIGKKIGTDGIDRIRVSLPGVRGDTIDDYVTKNATIATLEYRFPTKKKYALIGETQLAKFFDGHKLDWKGYYEQFPNSGGLYRFTRVGFSKDGKQAFVSVSHSCGGLCGQGNYYLLTLQDDNTWKITGQEMTWIS